MLLCMWDVEGMCVGFERPIYPTLHRYLLAQVDNHVRIDVCDERISFHEV
jgi:hypothetical protein